ncbi:23S rRNA pseudouridine2457 synthase [Rubritalea squalenifaciens DSM 18772]|uniref:Pseudouridine synthase n=1 Tax=Rubritalea squalenifaciens DSM 18772 TaxID=1123071 RepID=A0A1M6D7T6_9BACT|nr:pseudouridine synthase [Rubritalea squalenifaciens]SHI69260.1 23S rRNA pseudouridine2457 synthase [Rubritalea squalenifaciens DSM 18772]
MIVAFHKPYGVLSQFNKNPDYPDQRVLGECGLPEHLHPVGRLDLDSEGLLLLTDDKELETKLLDPKHGHRRCYLVQVDGQPDDLVIRELEAGGLQIKGGVTKPCKVKLLGEAPSLPERDPAVDVHAEARSSWLKMELTEGKNRQVRRMTAKVGFPTLRLMRISIGDLQLHELKPGESKLLIPEETALLFQ